MAQRKQKIEEPNPIYQKQKTSWLIKIGVEYYHRLLPIPFLFKIDLKHLKNI